MLSVVKFGTKVAVVGTAVYVTVDNSIWDKSDYAKGAIAKVKTSLPETTDLFKNTMPTSGSIAGQWNKGVENVFQAVGNSGETLSQLSRKAMSTISGQDNK